MNSSLSEEREITYGHAIKKKVLNLKCIKLSEGVNKYSVLFCSAPKCVFLACETFSRVISVCER